MRVNGERPRPARGLGRLLPVLVLLAAAVGVVLPAPVQAGPSSYHLEGGGFGHGVGMSQWGSKGMAEAGYSYGDILRHYYQGVTVGPIAPGGPLRIWLADDTAAPYETTLTAGGPVDLVLANGQRVATAAANDTIRIAIAGGGFEVYVNGGKVAGPVGGSGTNLHVHFDHGGPIKLDKTGYRYKYGLFDISTTGSMLRVVLADISMQEYLYGLGEVPSSWPANALKAQVLAARTYAREKQQRTGDYRSGCDCTLVTDVRDQNYTGYEKEVGTGAANWKAAVDQTNNEVITHGGSLIQAFYSSSSGGHTENSENVFIEALPYLRGVPDPHDNVAGNPLHRWSRDISRSEMETWLNGSSSTAVGTLDRVEFVSPYGVSGRVTRVLPGDKGGVRIVGSSGTKRVSGDTFRGAINRGSGSATKLPSALMQMDGWLAYPAGFTGGVFVAAGKAALPNQGERIVTGADTGGGPHVRLFTATGTETGGFFAYDTRFTGGVRVATCDLFGDGPPYEIVTAPGPGGGPHVRVFGIYGTDAGGFMAYDPRFTNGIFVACGDVDPSNPGGEIITGADAGGGPHVKVFSASGQHLGGGFFAYDPRFTGGVRVAVAGGGNAGPARIITAPGEGGGPHVRGFDATGRPIGFDVMAYDHRFTGGVYVGAGDVVGNDGIAEVIIGPGRHGGMHLRVFGVNGYHFRDVFIDRAGNHGARVAGLGGSGPAVVAAGGPGAPPTVSVAPQ